MPSTGVDLAERTPPSPVARPSRPTPDRAPDLPRWKKALFWSILLLVVLVTLEGSASVYLRLTRGYDGRHLYEFEFDPYKNILPASGFVDTRGVRHNEQGFRRAAAVSRAKPPGTYRIFLMGASTAYGTGGLWPHIDRSHPVLRDEETISAYLEEYLGAVAPGTRIEVINAAITSTWTHHNLIYLNQTILGYDPDMVLFLDGYNDFFHVEPGHDQFASYTYNGQSTAILGAPTVGSLVRANGWWLYRKSAFVHVAVRALRNLKLLLSTERGADRPAVDVDAAMARMTEVFPASALKMQRRSGLILRDEGVTAVFMLQPMLILERGHKPFTEVEQRMFEFNVESYLPNYEPFMHRAVEFVRARETAMAADVGAEFVDLTTIYGGVEEQIYTDYAHLTPAGNARLARVVADRIAPLIRRDLAARPDEAESAASLASAAPPTPGADSPR
jgi:lysophospholipase L1-like esterase